MATNMTKSQQILDIRDSDFDIWIQNNYLSITLKFHWEKIGSSHEQKLLFELIYLQQGDYSDIGHCLFIATRLNSILLGINFLESLGNYDQHWNIWTFGNKKFKKKSIQHKKSAVCLSIHGLGNRLVGRWNRLCLIQLIHLNEFSRILEFGRLHFGLVKSHKFSRSSSNSSRWNDFKLMLMHYKMCYCKYSANTYRGKQSSGRLSGIGRIVSSQIESHALDISRFSNLNLWIMASSNLIRLSYYKSDWLEVNRIPIHISCNTMSNYIQSLGLMFIEITLIWIQFVPRVVYRLPEMTNFLVSSRQHIHFWLDRNKQANRVVDAYYVLKCKMKGSEVNLMGSLTDVWAKASELVADEHMELSDEQLGSNE